MANIKTLLEKFYRKPIPNDIDYEELWRIAKHFGCEVDVGKGKHNTKVEYKPLGKVIPIPRHGKHVKHVYIRQVKELIDRIKEE